MNPVDAIGIKEVVLRLSAAALVGAALGLNRELHGKPAGVTTHSLVALGAAIVSILTMTLGSAAMDAGTLGRVIQGILTGVGFLGAGVIFRDPAGHISGLTTAATIWICAGLGIICGLGYWSMIGVALSIVFVVLVFGHRLEHLADRIFRHGQWARTDKQP